MTVRALVGGAICLAVAVAVAGGARGEVRTELAGRAAVDWSRGMLTAIGAAPADLRAPSAAVARVKAEREARQAARARLLELARKLPLAGETRVAEAIADDEAARARLEQAVGRSLDLEVDYGSDGSVVLTSGLPLEAVRLAVSGAPAPPADRDESAPTALVVDARRVRAEPALGLELVAGDERYAGPTVFYRRPDRARQDKRLGARPERVRAKGLEDGALVLEGGAPLSAAKRAGALVVVLLKRKAAKKGHTR